MAYCVQCGAALAAGARYCASCGTAQVAPTAPPLPGLPLAPVPPAQAQRAADTSTAQTVILVGAALAALLPILFALVFVGLGGFFAFFPFGAIPGFLFVLIGLMVIIGGVLFGAAGLWARNLVRDGQAEKGGLVALGTGALAVLTGNVIGGVVLLLGGFMAYTAR